MTDPDVTLEFEGLTCDGYILRCNFARLPLAILKNPDLSGGAVRTYGLMVWYLHKGARYPGHAAASHEFNIPLRSLKRHLRELEAADLIHSRRHGRGNPNTYHFPDPRLLPDPAREEVPDLAHQSTLMGHILSDDGPDTALRSARSGPPIRLDTSRTSDGTILDPEDPEFQHQHQAATAALDQVKADMEANHDAP